MHAPAAAIVNQAFLRAYALEGKALGRSIFLPSLAQDGQAPSMRVVGVAADLRPDIESDPRPAVYLHFQQSPWAYTRLLALVSGDPREAVPMLRENIWAEAPEVTLDGIRTLAEAVSEDLSGSRFSALLVGSFALLSLALAALGLYGVVSYSVQRQSRSLAVRRALGASEGGVVWLVLREALAQVAIGAALGLPLAWMLARLLTSQLYQVSAADPPAYLLTLLALAAAALASSVLPARRALRLDPATVLRQE
ncbi:MAG TPA: FtsX-like permease family protein [Acidobacteriota bacterium]|nr:FtsX-like permease family protein [Acidobacteriota bacterium]